MNNQKLKYLSKITAWVLLALIIVELVSGWGITRTEIIYRASLGIIDRGLANTIHRDIGIPMSAVLLTHILANIKLNLLPKSWRTRRAVNPMLIGVGIGLLALAIYMQQYP